MVKQKNHSQQKRQNTAITSGLDAGTSTLSEKIKGLEEHIHHEIWEHILHTSVIFSP